MKAYNYSDLKQALNIGADKDANEQQAFLTHYLQNNKNGISIKYKQYAVNYLTKVKLQESVITKNGFETNELLRDETQIIWDVPFPPPSDFKFTFIDLFAGIGGFRIAMQNLGGKCVYSSEIDYYAKITYEKNFGEVPFGDITKPEIKNAIPKNFELLCAGFPCQAFSIAGKRKGFEDTRGTLFFDIAKIIEMRKPMAIFLENVKGLMNHRGGETLKRILEVLRDELKYYVKKPQIINAKNFGVPQNRERVFIIGFRKDTNIEDFEYPKPINKLITFKDVKEEKVVDAKYYMSKQYYKTLIEHKNRHARKGNGFGYEVILDHEIANAVVVGGMGRERNLVIDKRLKDFTPTTHIKGEINRDGVRRMTPREWARLQGYPDKFRIEVADVHAYKQFGNSVAIPAIQATGEKIIQLLNEKGLLW